MDRRGYIDDYGTQVDPLFDTVETLEATIEKLQGEIELLEEIAKAAKKTMRFDLHQYNLHKKAGDYEHRDSDVLELLAALAKLEDKL